MNHATTTLTLTGIRLPTRPQGKKRETGQEKNRAAHGGTFVHRWLKDAQLPIVPGQHIRVKSWGGATKLVRNQ